MDERHLTFEIQKPNTMVNIYAITGMKDSGCIHKIQNELLKLPDVVSADVSLQFQDAVIETTRVIPLDVLQAAVSKAGAQYRITLKQKHWEKTKHRQGGFFTRLYEKIKKLWS